MRSTPKVSGEPSEEWSGVPTDSTLLRPAVSGPIGPGVVILDRYEILNVIGQGGVGIVYHAEHLENQRQFAIKILSQEWSTNRFAVRRFRAESRTAGSIGHPNVLRVEEAGAFLDGRLYVVMEYLDGVDLRRELAKSQVIAPLRASVLMRQVAHALGAVHALGVIHPDLKPSNIMIVPQKHGSELATVLDFGIAANTSATGLHGDKIQRDGWVMGAPQYMAPEQATGGTPSPACDIYAFGVILFEMLSGAPPIVAEHSFELLAFKRHNRAPSLRERAPDLPDTLIALVDECLEIDPAQRPPDANALVTRLEEVIAELHGDIVPIRITMVEEKAIPRRRRRGALFGAAAAVVVASLALVFFVVGGSSARPDAATVFADASPPAPPRPEPPAPTLITTAPPTTPATPPALATPEAAGAAQDPPTGRARPKPPPDRVPSVEPTPVEPTPVEPTPAEAVAKPLGPRAPKENAAATARCERVRKAAEEARNAHQWSSLRNQSRHTECWEDPTEARKWTTKASMELGDYAQCVAVGEGLKDPDVVGWVQLCRLRDGA